MQIPINTEPLRALDVPTRWLLATALDDAAAYAELAQKVQMGEAEIALPALPLDELGRKATAFRQIAEAVRDFGSDPEGKGA